MDENRQMVYSAIKTPDGTIIESLHRHDYNTHTDKNGKFYMIDGGLAYIRCTVNGDEEFITVYDDEPFEKVRRYFHWGRNFDKDMNRLPKTEWVKLCEITDDHLLALCDYDRAAGWCIVLFNKERKYRKL